MKSGASAKIWILAGVVLLSLVTGAAIYKGMHIMQSRQDGIDVDWRLLGELDYITGTAPEALKKLDGQRIKIPGFMVPLEDSMKKVTEFLLVPTPQACIHVPAPPPNQMLYVVMENGGESEVPYGPIWVYGTLKLVTKKSVYGEASFEIRGDHIEPYQ